MWNVMLVEDEPFVRRSIRDAIDWEAIGFRISAEASDGMEALEYMKHHAVDVVITDIMMPIMNGIELLEAANGLGSSSKFIMLTCMNEFEYARKALLNGASGYILKVSMEDHELQDALMKAVSELKKERMQQQIAHLSEYYDAIWKKLHGKQLEGSDTTRLQMVSEEEKWHTYVRLFVTLSDNQADLERMVSQCCRSEGTDKVIVHPYRNCGITTAFVWCDQKISFIEAWADSECNLSIYYTGLTHKEYLLQAWYGALEQLNKDWYGERGQKVGFRYVSVQENLIVNTSVEAVAWKDEREVIEWFEQMRWTECKDAVESIWGTMERGNTLTAIVRETADRLVKIFARISGNTPAELKLVEQCSSHRDLLVAIIQRIDEYAVQRIRQPATDHPLVNKIIDYIATYYDQEISLKSMAAYVNMDEQYLSGLFKKKVGESLIRYVQCIRVEQAKFYLAQTDLLVQEIGERVGYVHLNYFLKMFKKWTGLTPGEFRREVLSASIMRNNGNRSPNQ